MSACGVITTPGSLPIAGTTLSLSSGCKRDAQIQRLGRRAGLFGQQLRVVERVVERVQGVDHRVCRLDQGGPGLRRVQRVVVQVARRQHIAAAQFVHRGAPRRIGPQRERLMLTQPGMQPGGGPADLPAPLVARHLQLAVVAPGPVLGQMPGEAVVDRAGVLGVFRAEHLRVQVGGLQPGPGRVERFAGFVGVVAELGGRRGVADGQRAKELLRRRAGTLGPRGAARQRDHRDEQRPATTGATDVRVVFVAIGTDVRERGCRHRRRHTETQV